MEKKMPGEGKWFVDWNAKNAVLVRVIEKKIALRVSDVEPLLKPGLSANKMKITARVVPTDARYPCIGFLGSTEDDSPAELYVIITPEHLYSVYAIALPSSMTPSKIGFNLADWQKAISADSRMAPGDHARYETVLRDIKSKLDSGRSLTGEN